LVLLVFSSILRGASPISCYVFGPKPQIDGALVHQIAGASPFPFQSLPFFSSVLSAFLLLLLLLLLLSLLVLLAAAVFPLFFCFFFPSGLI
jgi:hypothetical protein